MTTFGICPTAGMKETPVRIATPKNEVAIVLRPSIKQSIYPLPFAQVNALEIVDFILSQPHCNQVLSNINVSINF